MTTVEMAKQFVTHHLQTGPVGLDDLSKMMTGMKFGFDDLYRAITDLDLQKNRDKVTGQLMVSMPPEVKNERKKYTLTKERIFKSHRFCEDKDLEYMRSRDNHFKNMSARRKEMFEKAWPVIRQDYLTGTKLTDLRLRLLASLPEFVSTDADTTELSRIAKYYGYRRFNKRTKKQLRKEARETKKLQSFNTANYQAPPFKATMPLTAADMNQNFVAPDTNKYFEQMVAIKAVMDLSIPIVKKLELIKMMVTST